MSQEILITGIGLCTPFGVGESLFVEGLRAGRSCAEPVSRFDTSGLRSHKACCVPVETFRDLKPSAQLLPRAHQFALVALADAIADSELDLESEDGSRIGVCYGAPSSTEHAERFHATLVERSPRVVSPLVFGNTTGMAGLGTLTVQYGITGPAIPLPSGFTSGLQALHVAEGLLRGGTVDLALVVATDEIAPLYYRVFAEMGLATPGRSRSGERSSPFDSRRNGIMLGEGAAAVILETRSHSTARGKTPRVELCGTAVSHEGREMNGRTDGQNAIGSDMEIDGVNAIGRAMRTALSRAGIEATDVGYVAACANSSASLDEAEAAALGELFPSTDTRRTAISSIKSMVGETGAAGGLINLAACIVAIEQGFIPPNINYFGHERPLELDIASSARGDREVGVAVANAYSLGGTAASAVVCPRDSNKQQTEQTENQENEV